MSSKDCSKLGLVILIAVLCHTFQQCGINAHPVEIKIEKNKKISKRAILCDVLDLILLAPVHSVGLLTTKRLRKLFCEDIPPRALPPHHHKDHNSTSELPLTTQQPISSVWTTIQPPKTSIQSSTSSPNLPVTETPVYQTTLSIPANEGTYDSTTNSPFVPNLEPKINVPETSIITTPSSETIPLTTIILNSTTLAPKNIVEEDGPFTTLQSTDKSTDPAEGNTIFTTPSFVTFPKTIKKDEIPSTTTNAFQGVPTTSPVPEDDLHTTLSPLDASTSKTVNQSEGAYTPQVTDEIPTTTSLPVDQDSSSKIYPTEKSTYPSESDKVTTDNSESNPKVTEKYDIPSTTIKILDDVPTTSAMPEVDSQTTIKSLDHPTTIKTVDEDEGSYGRPDATEKVPITTISSVNDHSSSKVQPTEKSTDAPESDNIITTESSEFYPKATEKYETSSSSLIEKEYTTSVPNDSPTTMKSSDEFTTPKVIDKDEGTYDTSDVTEEVPITTVSSAGNDSSSKTYPTEKSTEKIESDVVVTTESSEVVTKVPDTNDIASTTTKILEEEPTTSPVSEIDSQTTVKPLDQITTSKTIDQDKGTYDTPDVTEEIPITTAAPVDDSSSKIQPTEKFTDEPVVTTESSELHPTTTNKYDSSSTTSNILEKEPTTIVSDTDLLTTLNPTDYSTTLKPVSQHTYDTPNITEEIPITTVSSTGDDSSPKIYPTEKSTEKPNNDVVVTTESSETVTKVLETNDNASTTTKILEEEPTTSPASEIDSQTTVKPLDQITTSKTIDQDKGSYHTPDVTEEIPVTTASPADNDSQFNTQPTENFTDAPESDKIITTENSKDYPTVTENYESSSTMSNTFEKKPTTSVPNVDLPTTLKSLDEFTTPKVVDKDEGTYDTPDVTEEVPITTVSSTGDDSSSKTYPTEKSTEKIESNVVVTTESSEVVTKVPDTNDIASTTTKILEEEPTTSPVSEIDSQTTVKPLDQITTSKTIDQDKGTYDTPDVTEEIPITTAAPVDDSSSKIQPTEKFTDEPVVTTESSELQTTVKPLDQLTTSKTIDQDKGTYDTPDVTEEIPITTAAPVDDSSSKIQSTEKFTDEPVVTTESSELHSTATNKYDSSSTTSHVLEKEPTTIVPNIDLLTTLNPTDYSTTLKTVGQDTYDTPNLTEEIPITTVSSTGDDSSPKIYPTEKSTEKPDNDVVVTTESSVVVTKVPETNDIAPTTTKIIEEKFTTSPTSEVDSQTTLKPLDSFSTPKTDIQDESTEKSQPKVRPAVSSTVAPQTKMATETEFVPTTIEPIKTETIKYPSTIPQTVTTKSSEITVKQEVTVNPTIEPEPTFTDKNLTASPETKVEFDSPTLPPQQLSNDTQTTTTTIKDDSAIHLTTPDSVVTEHWQTEPVTISPKTTVKLADSSSTSVRPVTELQPTTKPELEKITTPEYHFEVKTTIKQDYETIHLKPSTESVKVSTESVTVSSTLAPYNSTEKIVTEPAIVTASSTSSPFTPTIESKINASEDPVSTKAPTTAHNDVSSTTTAPSVITSKSTASPRQKSTNTVPKGKCLVVQGILVCPDDSIENYFSEK